MSYTFIIGDRTCSSRSLRGWLLREKFGLTASLRLVDFDGAGYFKPQTVGDQLADIAPARTVPTLLAPEGAVISDSLMQAIARSLGLVGIRIIRTGMQIGRV